MCILQFSNKNFQIIWNTDFPHSPAHNSKFQDLTSSSLLIGSAFVKITDQKITGNLLIICIGYHCTQNTKDPGSILLTYQGLRPTDIEPLLSSVIPHQTTNTIFDIPSISITFLNQCLLTHKSLGLSLRTDYKPWPSTSVFFIIIKF